MKYVDYGNKGIQVSRIGFGAMRFENPADIDGSAETVLHAFEQGITYFDTAPGYCDDKSEIIVGTAVKEMKKTGKPFFLSSKSNKPDGKEFRAELERTLTRLNVDQLDFYNIWYVKSLAEWQGRVDGGAIGEILKAKEEGLIRFSNYTSHQPGWEIAQIIRENPWLDGMTLGYNATNFAHRLEGIKAAHAAGMGTALMNPLGGGMIPQNPRAFDFIRVHEGQSIVEAAIHFCMATEEATLPLIGFRNKSDVDDAVRAVESFREYTAEEMDSIKNHIEDSYDALCTTCGYCKGCPVDIPVWAFMETANGLFIEGAEKAENRLKYHWATSLDLLDSCTECRQCEDSCTQKLPILERFEKLKDLVASQASE
ncbi:MAG: aldo/keto reductase [Spirochaetales bacterium]|nr:aldo/keto reductase [Spirochaetales bacterium]